MKKTIALAALTVSTSAMALRPPPAETKTLCLHYYENDSGAKYAGRCDESENNVSEGLELTESGCTENQVAVVSKRFSKDQPWDISVPLCFPPNVTQL